MLTIQIILGIRRFIVRKLADQEGVEATTRRRWIVSARNATILLVAMIIVVIWLEQLRAMAATVVVIAAAIVVATKEFLLNILGYIYQSTSKFIEATPISTGVPKAGFMIESMVAASARNIRAMLDGVEPSAEPTLNAVCLADFWDSGVGFVAVSLIPPRNVNWSYCGKRIHLAKIAFENYFLREMREGIGEPYYERAVFTALGIDKLKKTD